MVLDFRHGFGLETLYFSPTPAVSSSQHAWDPTNSACLSGVVSPVSQILGMKKSVSAFRDAAVLWFRLSTHLFTFQLTIKLMKKSCCHATRRYGATLRMWKADYNDPTKYNHSEWRHGARV